MTRPAIVLVPATREDFEELAARSEFTPAVPACRVLAIAGKVEGRVVGLGGIAFFKDGRRVAFADFTDEARQYPLAMHKAGRKAVALARERGLRQLIARGDSHPASRRWLMRLGFLPVETNQGTNYVLVL